MKDKYRRLLSDTGLFAIGNFGSKFILFFLVPLYTNILTTSEYGMADFITTSTVLLMPFVTLSINDALLRFCLDKNEDKENVLWQSGYVLVGANILLVLLYMPIKKINLFVGFDLFFLIITSLLSVRSLFSLYLKSIGKIRVYAIDSILYTLVLCISNIIFLLVIKMRLKGYLLAQIIALLFSILFIIYYGKIFKNKCIKKLDIYLLKKMLKYSIPLIANAMSWWIINSSDRYMLKYILGNESVGLYAIATKMPSLLTSITSVFYQAWLISSIVEYEKEKDKEFYKNVFKVYLFILSIGASGILLFLKPFMKIYVGSEFVQSWKFVPVLLMASIFSTFANYFMAFYKSAMKNYREVVATGIGALTNILLNLCLIPAIGIQGACIATLFSEMIMTLFVIYDTRRFFKFEINFFKFFMAIIIILIQNATIVIFENYYFVVLSVVCFICLCMLFYSDYFPFLKKIIILLRKVC